MSELDQPPIVGVKNVDRCNRIMNGYTGRGKAVGCIRIPHPPGTMHDNGWIRWCYPDERETDG